MFNIQEDLEEFYATNPIPSDLSVIMNESSRQKKYIPIAFNQGDVMASVILRGIVSGNSPIFIVTQGQPYLSLYGNFVEETNEEGLTNELTKSALILQLSDEFQPPHVLEELEAMLKQLNMDTQELVNNDNVKLGSYINIATSLDTLKFKNKCIELGWKGTLVENFMGLPAIKSDINTDFHGQLKGTLYELRKGLLPVVYVINDCGDPVLAKETLRIREGDYVEIEFRFLSYKGKDSYGVQAFLQNITLINRTEKRKCPAKPIVNNSPAKKSRFASSEDVANRRRLILELNDEIHDDGEPQTPIVKKKKDKRVV